MTNPLTTDQRRAFLSAPNPERYYAASAIEEARQRIVRSIARHEGPALIVGAVGTGKSMLLAVLAEQFEPRMSVVTLPGAQLCTRRALLQMILSELRLPYRHMDEGELRLSILEHLRGPAASAPRLADAPETSQAAGKAAPRPAPGRPPRRMLLLVDEADALPTRLLEELRVLTNVVSHGMPLVSLVLAGGPVLEERFADPQLDMFSQRIGARCYLAPFSREETFQYVRSQVSAVGVKPDKWFDPDALAAIHGATGGVPRLVNQLGDQLVWLIEETGCQPLDAALVQQAWSDLQQLPAPWNTDAHSSLSSADPASVGAIVDGLVEFAELDGEAFEVHPLVDEFDGGDDAVELFARPADSNDAPLGMFDDDLPASIPFAAARPRRDADLAGYASALDATQALVDQFDELDLFDFAPERNDSPPTPQPEPETPAAENPFQEPFEEEEILVDPYSEFESQLLRAARHVVNRIDRTFAAELARCEHRREARLSATTLPATAAATNASPDAASTAPPARENEPPAASTSRDAANHQGIAFGTRPAAPTPATTSPSPPEVRVAESANRSATVVPGRQFRRLFSSLDSDDGPRARHG